MPRAGERAQAARLPGAATALALARLTRTLGAERRTLIVVCADAQDVHQLASEIGWFDPSLRVREFSDWKPSPTTIFRHTRTWSAIVCRPFMPWRLAPVM